MLTEWKRKWKSLKDNASRRGLVCDLTLDEYVELALEAGIDSPSQIGKSLGLFQMSRKGDVGPYRVGNCRFILMEDNLKELSENGGHLRKAQKMRGRTKETHAGVLSQSQKMTGRTKHNDPGMARMSLKMRGRTKETHSGLAITAKKLSKSFRLVSPSGKVHRGINVREFAKEHDLERGNLSKVLRGEASHCSGWTGKYLSKKLLGVAY